MIIGKENIIITDEPQFGTEDFANISQLVPSSMQLIGGFDETIGKPYPLHHPQVKISDKTLKYGVKYFVNIAKEVLMK